MQGPCVSVDAHDGSADCWRVHVWYTYDVRLASPRLVSLVEQLLSDALAPLPQLTVRGAHVRRSATSAGDSGDGAGAAAGSDGRVTLTWELAGGRGASVDCMPWEAAVRRVMVPLLEQCLASGAYLTPAEVAQGRRVYALLPPSARTVDEWLEWLEDRKRAGHAVAALAWTDDERAWLAAHPTSDRQEAAVALRDRGELVAWRDTDSGQLREHASFT
jgi:hypothetical protein